MQMSNVRYANSITLYYPIQSNTVPQSCIVSTISHQIMSSLISCGILRLDRQFIAITTAQIYRQRSGTMLPLASTLGQTKKAWGNWRNLSLDVHTEGSLKSKNKCSNPLKNIVSGLSNAIPPDFNS